jgi:tetraacyldisaccharide 4'-kinase
LAPLGWCFRGLVSLRRLAFNSGLFRVFEAPVPVIVVGNVTVGGTGKTPLVIWLADYLQRRGQRPGIVARGYRGRATKWPQQVRADGDPNTVGDEAIVIARQTVCPVVVGPNRAQCVEALLNHADCNIVVADDGLQHYGLARDIEIAVIDGVRRFGNNRCLPAGPLREPVARLGTVDLIVTNGIAGRGEFSMKYLAGELVNLASAERRVAIEAFEDKEIHAIAGTGYPEHFFSYLRSKGFRLSPHAFGDHHRYRPGDLDFGDRLPVVMTEKDAVKCEAFASSRYWYVPIKAVLPEVFERRLDIILSKVTHGQETA